MCMHIHRSTIYDSEKVETIYEAGSLTTNHQGKLPEHGGQPRPSLCLRLEPGVGTLYLVYPGLQNDQLPEYVTTEHLHTQHVI